MWGRIWILLLAAVLVPGCKSTAQPEEGAAVVVPEDFLMEFGQGGGFSGLWQGYTIRADSTVWAWTGPTAGANAERRGRLSGAQMDTLWQRVQAADFFARDRRDVGNMTAFIEVQAQGRRHRASWIPRVLGAPETPLEQLYVYGRALAEAAGS